MIDDIGHGLFAGRDGVRGRRGVVGRARAGLAESRRGRERDVADDRDEDDQQRGADDLARPVARRPDDRRWGRLQAADGRGPRTRRSARRNGWRRGDGGVRPDALEQREIEATGGAEPGRVGPSRPAHRAEPSFQGASSCSTHPQYAVTASRSSAGDRGCQTDRRRRYLYTTNASTSMRRPGDELRSWIVWVPRVPQLVLKRTRIHCLKSCRRSTSPRRTPST